MSSPVRSLVCHSLPKEMGKWIIFHLLCRHLSHSINYSFCKIARCSPWSQASHASPWWHNVCLSGRAIVHSVASPRKVLALSPAIWHCLTKDTNISNWIQPLCERFSPILRKDNMMFSEYRAPASQSWIGAHPYSTGWNRTGLQQLLLPHKKTTNIFYMGLKMSCLSFTAWKKCTMVWIGVRFALALVTWSGGGALYIVLISTEKELHNGSNEV